MLEIPWSKPLRCSKRLHTYLPCCILVHSPKCLRNQREYSVIPKACRYASLLRKSSPMSGADPTPGLTWKGLVCLVLPNRSYIASIPGEYVAHSHEGYPMLVAVLSTSRLRTRATSASTFNRPISCNAATRSIEKREKQASPWY